MPPNTFPDDRIFQRMAWIDLQGTSQGCVLERQYSSLWILVVFLSYESQAEYTV
jgi:hypothetical protein